LPLAPRDGTLLGFAGGVSVPRTTGAVARPWALPSCPARRRRGPRLRRLRPGLPGADELAMGGRRLDPGAAPPPSLQRLALSTSGACRPHDGVVKRALGLLLRPALLLPDLDRDCQETIVCVAGAGAHSNSPLLLTMTIRGEFRWPPARGESRWLPVESADGRQWGVLMSAGGASSSVDPGGVNSRAARCC